MYFQRSTVANTLTPLALRVVVILHPWVTIKSLLGLRLVLVEDVHTDSLQLLKADKHGHIPRAETYKVGHESFVKRKWATFSEHLGSDIHGALVLSRG